MRTSTKLALLSALFSATLRAQTTIRIPADQPTIQAGINAAHTGDTVLVYPGTYFENIDFKGKAITVTSSAGAATTIIDGANKAPVVTFSTGETRAAILSNLTITHGGAGTGPYGLYGSGGVVVSSSAPTVLNNVITANYCQNVYMAGAAPLIQGNVISNSLTPEKCFVLLTGGIYVGSNLQASTPGNPNGTPATIIGNTIEGNTTGQSGDGGGDGGPGIAIWGGSPLIQNNIIRNNFTRTGSGGGINIVYGTGISIIQNLIYGNNAGCGGGAIGSEMGGLGPDTYLLIANNTMVGNGNVGGGGYSDCRKTSEIWTAFYNGGGPTIKFVNNIFDANAAPALDCGYLQGGTSDPIDEAHQSLFDHNILYDTAGTFFATNCFDSSHLHGNLVADPQFTDLAAHDFHLKATSPAIDAGNGSVLQNLKTLSGLTLTQDYAGNPRELDATAKGSPTIDIGAYEFAGLNDGSPTRVVLSSSAYSGNAGSSFTLTASLSSALGVPTGAVTFTSDGVQIGVVNAVNGVATLSNVPFKPGAHVLLASYAGQGSFPAAVSVIVIVYLDKYAGSLSLTSAPNPSLTGQAVTFNVKVSEPDGSIPSPITVTFNNATLATLQPDSGGNASFTTSALPKGFDSIYAAWPGDNTYAGLTAYDYQQVVDGYPVFLALTSSQNPSLINQSVTFSVHVSAQNTSNATPTGSITFTDGSTTLGTQTLDASGNTSLSTSTLTVGTHFIVATYNPTGSFASSANTLSQQVLSGYATNGTLSSSQNPSQLNASVTFTATFTSTNGVPTGSVQFSDNGTLFATQPLSNTGSASAAYAFTTIGNHTVAAMLVPTGSFSASTATLIQTVNPGPATQTITFPQPANAFAGTAIPITATASSGLAVTYTLVSGPGKLYGNVLAFTDAGNIVVQADQPGNAATQPAPPVQISIAVTTLIEPVGTASPTLLALVTFTASGTLSTTNILTQGAPNLDFGPTQTGAVNGTVTTCAIGTTYAAAQTCLVSFRFKPTAPGQRIGGAALVSTINTPLASLQLYGTGTAPLATWNNPTQKKLASSALPTGIAIDGSGNLYFSDQLNGSIEELLAVGGVLPANPVKRTLLSGIDPIDITLDGLGNLYVSEIGGQRILELLAVGGTMPANPATRVLATNLNQPLGIAVDKRGNVFFAEEQSPPSGKSPDVVEILAVDGVIPASPSLRVVVNGLNAPKGLAVDQFGNLFVGDGGAGTILQIVAVNGVIPASPTVRTIASGFANPEGMAVDSNGNLFIADTTTITELLAVGGALPASPARKLWATNLNYPEGVVLDRFGNIFFNDTYNGQIFQLDTNTPPTLNFAPTHVGSTSTDSPQTITLVNTGNASLLFATPSITSSSPSFPFDNNSPCNQLSALAAGASCTESVSFRPTAPGAQQGLLSTFDNTLNVSSFQAVPLNGTGVANLVTATLTVNPTSSTYGTPIALTATLTSATSGTPTGTVTFFADGAALSTAALNTSAVASYSATGLNAGPHTFTCTYSGDATFTTSTCAAVPATITPAATALTLTVTPNPVAALANTTVTAVLTSGAQPITGAIINFTLDGKALTPVTTLPIVGARFVITLPTGTHTLTATYAATTNYAASTTSASETATPNPTSITLTGAPNPIAQTQSVTLAATIVSPAANASPYGTVTFYDGATALATIATGPLTYGTNLATATLVLSSLTPGTHTLTAAFTPADANFIASVSAPFVLTVLPQDYKLSTTAPTLTVQTEHHATLGVTLTSIGGYTGTFSLGCGTLPDYAHCFWTPTTVTLPANGTVTTQLEIDTDAVYHFKAATTPRPGYPTAPIFLALTPFAFFLFAKRRTFRRSITLLPILAITLLAPTTLTGCGSKYPGSTTPGTYSISLTATPMSASSTTTKTITLNLVVTM